MGMENNQEIYAIANKLLSKKVYEYDGPLNSREGIKLKFKYRFKILGDFSLIHMGEPMNHIGIELTIVDMEYPILADLFKGFNGVDLHLNRYNFVDRFYFLSTKLSSAIWGELKYFSITDSPEIVFINLDIPNEDLKEPSQITESKNTKRNIVRKIVGDIVNVFKEKGEGEYELPEDVSEDLTYSFDNISNEFNLELTITKSDAVDGYEIDGGYYDDENMMEIEIIYNEKYFPQQMYDLVGSLNETVSHELQHLIQYYRGDKIPKNPTNNPKKYYLQPHELDAQVAGLKRVSKLRNQPIEQSARESFDKNQSKHKLDKEYQEKVIQKILQHYTNGK